MIRQQFALETGKDFGFWATALSHGWCVLSPFALDLERRVLSRILQTQSGKLVRVQLSESMPGRVAVVAESPERLSGADKKDLLLALQDCLRLKENYKAFYQLAGKEKDFKWVRRLRAGRLLRCPTVFEDIVKMILTTNCNWRQTENMVGNLVNALGDPFDAQGKSFPSPLTIASVTPNFMARVVRAGYRGPYIIELARRVVQGDLDVEAWRHSPAPSDVLYREIKGIKGVGDYAAGNLMKLLGRYDYLALDSWCRKKFADLRNEGRIVPDRQIAKFYVKYGQWQGLMVWMDVTRQWFGKEIKGRGPEAWK